MALLFSAGCDQPPPATDEIVEPEEIDELEQGEDSLQGTEIDEGEGAARRVQRRESAVEREGPFVDDEAETVP